MACMLCAKKTIFIIEKNTTILQSMFVINKMTKWMTVGLRVNRVWKAITDHGGWWIVV